MCKEKIERVSELFAALGVRQTNLYEDISIVGREEMFKYFPELDESYRPYIEHKVMTFVYAMDDLARVLDEKEINQSSPATKEDLPSPVAVDELDVLRKKVRDCQRIVYVGLALSALSLTLTIFNLLQ